MDFVERFSGLASGRATVPAAKLLSFTDLSPRIQSHLAQARWGCLLLVVRRSAARRLLGTFWHQELPCLKAGPFVHFLALQVYVTLALALLLSAAGVWVSAATGFGSGLGMIGFMVRFWYKLFRLELCRTWMPTPQPRDAWRQTSASAFADLPHA